MNLFQDETSNLLLDLGFEEGWVTALSPFLSANVLSGILMSIKKERETKTIYPDEQDVFKVFKICPFKSIKVVVIGQDPYFNGNADGIAFSCKINISPSLQQIMSAMCKDTDNQEYSHLGYLPKHLMNLEYLCKQGVFLYNPSLTVIKDQPMSHAYIGWSAFSNAVYKALLANKSTLVWMAWGKVAQNSLPFNIPEYHLTLKASHPVSASYGGSTWQCNHFSESNKYLLTKGQEEIKWL